METIKTYIDNLFETVPNTEEVENIKSDLLDTMTDKYNELKNEGKSDNEAVGSVISEFGNIDELLDELNIKHEEEKEEEPETISYEQAKKYLLFKFKFAFLIALGVFMCILAPALYCLFEHVNENDNLSLFLMFLLIASAVSIFVFEGSRNSKYSHLEETLNVNKKYIPLLEKESADVKPKLLVSLVFGIFLCIVSPLAYTFSKDSFGSESMADFLFLFIVAIGVFFIVLSGIISGSYEICTRTLTIDQIKYKKLSSSISTIIFTIATAIFFVCGFLFKVWEYSWVIFVVAALLNTVISEIRKMKLKAK